MKKNLHPLFLFSMIYVFFAGCKDKRIDEKNNATLTIYIESILNDVSNHPIGINIEYFMDGGRYPDGQRITTHALKAMGVKYLRYPGGMSK